MSTASSRIPLGPLCSSILCDFDLHLSSARLSLDSGCALEIPEMGPVPRTPRGDFDKERNFGALPLMSESDGESDGTPLAGDSGDTLVAADILQPLSACSLEWENVGREEEDDDEEETDLLTPLACAHRASPKESPHSDRPPRFSDVPDASASPTGAAMWGDAYFNNTKSSLDVPLEACAAPSPVGPGRHSKSHDERRFPGVKILSDFACQGLTASSSLSRLDRLVEAQSSWLVPASEVTIGEPLREDAFGSVHLGRWRGTKALLRTLRVRVGHELPPDIARELLGELASPMRHPNLALHMGTCRPDDLTGEILTIHEYLSAGTVADFALRGDVDVARACAWTLSLARVLCFLHSSKPAIIVGRLRPDHLLVDTDMNVKLCDVELQNAFRRKGIPLQFSRDEEDAKHPSRVFDAPELDSVRDSQPNADVYSAGVVALMLLLGRVPTRNDIAAARGKRRRPFARRDTVLFSAVVGPMVAEDPTERPSSADVVRKLEECSKAIRQGGAKVGGCAVS